MALTALSIAGTAAAVEVVFTYEPPPDLEVGSVSLRGSFNNWGETPMTEEDGIWSASVELEPGEHEYKYFINGEWPSDMESWHDGTPVDPTADRYTDDRERCPSLNSAPQVEPREAELESHALDRVAHDEQQQRQRDRRQLADGKRDTRHQDRVDCRYQPDPV